MNTEIKVHTCFIKVATFWLQETLLEAQGDFPHKSACCFFAKFLTLFHPIIFPTKVSSNHLHKFPMPTCKSWRHTLLFFKDDCLLASSQKFFPTADPFPEQSCQCSGKHLCGGVTRLAGMDEELLILNSLSYFQKSDQ